MTLRKGVPFLLLTISFILAVTAHARAQGTLYIANQGGSAIDTADSSGNLSTFAPSDGPNFLAADSAGNIYVSSLGSTGGLVEKYSSTGVDLGVYASGISLPQGMAFDSSGNLFVTDSFSDSIVKVAPGGGKSNFVNTGLSSFPVGLAINSQGNIFVGNLSSNSINVYNAGGTLLQSITDSVFSPGQLTFDSVGDLFVANQGVNNNHYSIEEYTALPGGTISSVGTEFVNTGGDRPTGLAFDQNGNLYASYGEEDIIEKFSPTGVDLGVFASDGNLSEPVNGLLFVPSASSAPEPATWALLLLGIPVFAVLRRRRQA